MFLFFLPESFPACNIVIRGFSTGVGLVFLQAVKCKIRKENTELLGIIWAN